MCRHLQHNASAVSRSLLAIALVFLFCACSQAAQVRSYLRNPDGGALATNVFWVIPANGSNVLSSGGIVTGGVPIRTTPASDGYATNNLAQGFYVISNRFTGLGIRIKVPEDNTSSVYDYTNLLRSGYNNFVDVGVDRDGVASVLEAGSSITFTTNGPKLVISSTATGGGDTFHQTNTVAGGYTNKFGGVWTVDGLTRSTNGFAWPRYSLQQDGATFRLRDDSVVEDVIIYDPGASRTTFGENVTVGEDLHINDQLRAANITNAGVTSSLVGSDANGKQLPVTINGASYVNFADGELTFTAIPLSSLGQSGAGVGQIPKWNGSAYVASDDNAGAGSQSLAQTLTIGNNANLRTITNIGSLSVTGDASGVLPFLEMKPHGDSEQRGAGGLTWSAIYSANPGGDTNKNKIFVLNAFNMDVNANQVDGREPSYGLIMETWWNGAGVQPEGHQMEIYWLYRAPSNALVLRTEGEVLRGTNTFQKQIKMGSWAFNHWKFTNVLGSAWNQFQIDGGQGNNAGATVTLYGALNVNSNSSNNGEINLNSGRMRFRDLVQAKSTTLGHDENFANKPLKLTGNSTTTLEVTGMRSNLFNAPIMVTNGGPQYVILTPEGIITATAGAFITNASLHNPTSMWNSATGTMRTRYTENAGNPKLEFVGEAGDPVFTINFNDGQGVSADAFAGNGDAITMTADPYNSATWNDSTKPATQGDVRDKIESISGGAPGGANTQVQFNDSSAFGGDAGLTYNKTTDALTVGGAANVNSLSVGSGEATIDDLGNVKLRGTLGVGGTSVFTNGASFNAGATVFGTLWATNIVSNQDALFIGGESASDPVFVTTPLQAVAASFETARATNYIAIHSNSPSAWLATPLTYGEILLINSNGTLYQKKATISGSLAWASTNEFGGSSTPGGANTQVQFNDSGSFNGDAGLVYNKTTDALTVNGALVANSVSAVNDVNATTVNANAVAVTGDAIVTGAVTAGNGKAGFTAQGVAFASPGGSSNFVAGHYTLAHGFTNNTSSDRSFAIGGATNTVTDSDGSGILGGQSNIVRLSMLSAIIGGSGNLIYPEAANQLFASNNVILGGYSNRINGANNIAGGRLANALHDGSFIWQSGDATALFETTANNQFLVKASGGFGINTNSMSGAALNVHGTIAASSITPGAGGLHATNGNNTISPIAGTTDGTPSPAGTWGEMLTNTLASGSAISLTTATAANVASLSLTAGKWQVWFIAGFNPAATTTTTYFRAGISTTSATMPSDPWQTATLPVAATLDPIDILLSTPVTPIIITGTTTVYAVVDAGFATSTMTAYGRLYARRVP